MRRREFFGLVGGAVAWTLPTRAQQTAKPLIGVVGGGSAAGFTRELVAFRKGLSETGYTEGQNITVEYHWLEGKYDRLPALMEDLVSRKVAVIATNGSGPAAVAAKAATSAIPIVFGLGEDPVQLGLVASVARPGGNATGINFFTNEVVAKRFRLLHDLLPKAARVAVLLNPSNVPSTKSTLGAVGPSAQTMGLQIQTLNATTPAEIDAAFDTLEHEHFDALFVAPDAFFTSRAVQFAILAARSRIPASYGVHEFVMAGGLMAYGTDIADMNYNIGIYVGKILNGAKPADLPVLQSSKFALMLNLQTARALHIDVPPSVQSIVDETIE